LDPAAHDALLLCRLANAGYTGTLYVHLARFAGRILDIRVAPPVGHWAGATIDLAGQHRLLDTVHAAILASLRRRTVLRYFSLCHCRDAYQAGCPLLEYDELLNAVEEAGLIPSSLTERKGAYGHNSRGQNMVRWFLGVARPIINRSQKGGIS